MTTLEKLAKVTVSAELDLEVNWWRISPDVVTWRVYGKRYDHTVAYAGEGETIEAAIVDLLVNMGAL